MKILILGGFLGVGKTTLLMQLAAYYTGNRRKIAIIENKAESNGIADRNLQASGFQVRNLLSNCICCSGAGELVSAVRQIRQDYAPETLLIEASGLSQPVSIRENLLQYGLGENPRIVAMVDAVRFLRQAKAAPALVLPQLEKADVLLLNKADAADRERLDRIRAAIRESAPAAILEISAISPLPREVLEQIAGEGQQTGTGT